MRPDVIATRPPRLAGRPAWLLPLIYAAAMLAGGGIRRAVRFLGRGATCPRATVDWLAYVDAGPLRAAPLAARLDLAQKIYRPFARRDVDLAGRIARLRAHYDALALRLSVSAIARLASGRPLVLAMLPGRSGRRYDITVVRDCRFGKEGEISVALKARGPDIVLATATFALDRVRNGRPWLSLGGLQGPPRPHGRDEVVAATRDLHGLRPKRAVIAAAGALARWLGAGAIVAVSKVNHVSHATNRHAPIRADYDAFWEELGGSRRADGDFDLPLDPPRRSPDEVPAKRRKEWLRRCALTDDLAWQIPQSLDRALEPIAGLPTAIPIKRTARSPLYLPNHPLGEDGSR
jgi:uncharacterized protein VirK/YbjX